MWYSEPRERLIRQHAKHWMALCYPIFSRTGITWFSLWSSSKTKFEIYEWKRSYNYTTWSACVALTCISRGCARKGEIKSSDSDIVVLFFFFRGRLVPYGILTIPRTFVLLSDHPFRIKIDYPRIWIYFLKGIFRNRERRISQVRTV